MATVNYVPYRAFPAGAKSNRTRQLMDAINHSASILLEFYIKRRSQSTNQSISIQLRKGGINRGGRSWHAGAPSTAMGANLQSAIDFFWPCKGVINSDGTHRMVAIAATPLQRYSKLDFSESLQRHTNPRD